MKDLPEDDPKAATRAKKVGRFRLRKARCAGVMDGLCAALNKDSVVVDCGANVGVVTVPLARTGARVISFEPDEVAFAELSAAAAGLSNVELHQAAVGTEPGTVRLYRAQSFTDDPVKATVSSSVMTGKRGQSEENSIEVEQIDLVSFLSKLVKECGRIDFLKMDIEGAELTLLPALIKAGLIDKVRYMAVETHERKFPAQRGDFRQMRRTVSGLYPQTHVNLNWI